MRQPIKDFEKPQKVLHTFLPMKVHHLLAEISYRHHTTLKDMLIEAIKDLAVKYNIKCED